MIPKNFSSLNLNPPMPSPKPNPTRIFHCFLDTLLNPRGLAVDLLVILIGIWAANNPDCPGVPMANWFLGFGLLCMLQTFFRLTSSCLDESRFIRIIGVVILALTLLWAGIGCYTFFGLPTPDFVDPSSEIHCEKGLFVLTYLLMNVFLYLLLAVAGVVVAGGIWLAFHAISQKV